MGQVIKVDRSKHHEKSKIIQILVERKKPLE